MAQILTPRKGYGAQFVILSEMPASPVIVRIPTSRRRAKCAMRTGIWTCRDRTQMSKGNARRRLN